MTRVTDDFRCSVTSNDDDEPIAGTAPTDEAFLLVEYAGPWGRHALAESRLPQPVKDRLDALPGTRVQLIRRHGRTSRPGVRVFHAVATHDAFAVTTTVVDAVEDLVNLDLGDLTTHEAGLWLVCTNGRRDRCCAEVGRPIATQLASRWPEETWETTHLGGHRFSGTLLALPSGHTLGRLTSRNAEAACGQVESGAVPVELSRGRAGRAPVDQVRELHLLSGGSPDVDFVEVPGPQRRASCGDLTLKATTIVEARPR